MKEKIFSLSGEILSWFPISSACQGKISNWANLFFLTLKDGGKFTLRSEETHKISRDFVKNYLFQGAASEKVSGLKKGLDAESQNLVDEILKRQEYIFTHNLLDNKAIFNPDELKKQKIVESFRRKKNDYFRICAYPETFFYHSGLKILPEATIKTIRGKDVIDGGAFIGDTAIVFCKNYSLGKIYSFEPQRDNFIKLKKNIQKYEMENVIAVNLGFGSKEGKVSMARQGVSSRIDPAGNEAIEITTVDHFVEKNGCNIGLIKFDIEGAEFDGIVGVRHTIEKFKPVLIISIYHTGKDFFEIKPYLESLNLGYKFLIRKLNPTAYIYETTLLAYVDNQ